MKGKVCVGGADGRKWKKSALLNCNGGKSTKTVSTHLFDSNQDYPATILIFTTVANSFLFFFLFFDDVMDSVKITPLHSMQKM
jgi:hypothetical protein